MQFELELQKFIHSYELNNINYECLHNSDIFIKTYLYKYTGSHNEYYFPVHEEKKNEFLKLKGAKIHTIDKDNIDISTIPEIIEKKVSLFTDIPKDLILIKNILENIIQNADKMFHHVKTKHGNLNLKNTKSAKSMFLLKSMLDYGYKINLYPNKKIIRAELKKSIKTKNPKKYKEKLRRVYEEHKENYLKEEYRQLCIKYVENIYNIVIHEIDFYNKIINQQSLCFIPETDFYYSENKEDIIQTMFKYSSPSNVDYIRMIRIRYPMSFSITKIKDEVFTSDCIFLVYNSKNEWHLFGGMIDKNEANIQWLNELQEKKYQQYTVFD